MSKIIISDVHGNIITKKVNKNIVNLFVDKLYLFIFILCIVCGIYYLYESKNNIDNIQTKKGIFFNDNTGEFYINKKCNCKVTSPNGKKVNRLKVKNVKMIKDNNSHLSFTFLDRNIPYESFRVYYNNSKQTIYNPYLEGDLYLSVTELDDRVIFEQTSHTSKYSITCFSKY